MQLEALFESNSEESADESEDNASGGSPRMSVFDHLIQAQEDKDSEATTDEDSESHSPMGCLEMMNNAMGSTPDISTGLALEFNIEPSQTPLHAKTRRLSLEFNGTGNSPPSALPAMTIHSIMEQQDLEDEEFESNNQSGFCIAFHSDASGSSSDTEENQNASDCAPSESNSPVRSLAIGGSTTHSPVRSLAIAGSRTPSPVNEFADVQKDRQSHDDEANEESEDAVTNVTDVVKDALTGESEVSEVFSTPMPTPTTSSSLSPTAECSSESILRRNSPPDSASISPPKPRFTGHCDVDRMIAKLLEARHGVRGREIKLCEREIMALCHNAQQLMMSQPMFFELSAPIHIVGDVHGQYYDLLRLFELGGFPPDTNYLFLGDYVDRGHQSLETICLLLAYKLKYPENFFILRGNHESSSISRVYGFFDECKRRYTMRVWKTFCDLFNCFPIAARIDDMILCMHGGLSPDLNNFEQLKAIVRPTDVPEAGLLCDILWSDPDKNNPGWGVNDRGLSYTFGADVLHEFLCKHEMDMVIRAHQVVEDGYEFFAKRQCVTVFSAPNYCGEYDNGAAIVAIDPDLYVSILLLTDD